MTEESIVKRKRKGKIKNGEKFGRLEVLEFTESRKHHLYFKCQCKCGNTKIIHGGNLRSGHTQSCGCLQKEKITTHGMSDTPTYSTWESMVQRCANPKDAAYKDYGDRGITICPEWRSSFIAFFRDMGEKPKGLTVERIDNDKGYCKENCKWGTRIEQSRNRRVGKRNKTGATGVRRNGEGRKGQKYSVDIGTNYKQYRIGSFKNLEDAKAARIAAEKKYWKQET